MSLREPTPTRRMSALPKPLAVPKPYQVEEMQVKIRELEGTIEKLKTALNTEQTRSKDTVQKIQQTWTKERAEWQAGCDAIQVAHRINFLKTAIEVDNQKAAVLREKDGYRIHQISRLQRDFNLVKFQLHEVEQEERHAQLEDEVERLQEALEDARSTFQEELDSFRERCEKVEKQLARKVEEAEGLLEEKSQIEKSLAGLRAEHTSLLSSSTTKGSDLERANLRYDSLKSSHTELEAKLSELQQTNADLRRQLDKWRDLEHREGDELSELRKVKIELKVQISDLEGKLEEASKKAKERKEKVRAVFQEQEEALEEAAELTKRLEAEKEEMRVCLAEAEKLVQDLKVRAEAERSRAEAALEIAKGPSGSGSTTVQRGPTPRVPEPSEAVDDDVIISPPRPKSKAAGGSKGRHTTSKMVKDDEVEIQKSLRNSTKGKGKAKAIDLVSDDDVAPPKPQPRGKKTLPKKSFSATANNEGDDDVQQAPPKRKGKRKPATDDNDANDTSDEDRGKPAKSNAASSAKSKSAGKPKPPSRQASSRKGEEVEEKDDDGEPESGMPKKKKRKINLFPGSQPTAFNWGDQAGGGLDIPMDLSPVKEHDAVPPRSTSRLGSTVSWNRR